MGVIKPLGLSEIVIPQAKGLKMGLPTPFSAQFFIHHTIIGGGGLLCITVIHLPLGHKLGRQ